MAASSQVSQNKRSREEYLKGGLASPDAKRTNSRTLGYGNDLAAVIENNDNVDNNKETDAVNEVEVEVEMKLNGVIKCLEDEIGLKAQTDNNLESTNEKGNTDQMGSNKKGELTVEVNPVVTSVTSDIGNFTNHDDDVLADLDFFVDNITPDELRIMMQNYFEQDSVPDIMYSDTVHGCIESTETSYGSVRGGDIRSLNEDPVIQNDFTSPQQEESGISGAKFHEVRK